jgi:hypothetical protein
MSNQPEALRLADAIDPLIRNRLDNLTCATAATELRRLHQSEREGWRYAAELEQERIHLNAVNQELLNALHCISLASQDSGSTREGMGLYARAAIAKAEEQA